MPGKTDLSPAGNACGRQWRQIFSLTAKTQESDKVMGFQRRRRLYLKALFNAELLSRIKALREGVIYRPLKRKGNASSSDRRTFWWITVTKKCFCGRRRSHTHTHRIRFAGADDEVPKKVFSAQTSMESGGKKLYIYGKQYHRRTYQ